VIGPGTIIRDIRIVEQLGAGGMGETWLGVQEAIGREVAVKVIRAERRLDAAAKARFLREAHILGQLEHPNICRLYDFVETDEADLIVLELIRGRSLRELLAEPLDDEAKLRIASQVLAALEAAHAISVVHRDLKPDNIMVADDGTVKVLDFGLARHAIPGAAIDRTDPNGPPAGAGDDRATEDPGVTRLGEVVGTPRYLSPEQARGDQLTAASDMFVFGLLLRELWTGRPPFSEELTVRRLVMKAMMGEVEPVTGIDPAVAGLIGELCAVEARDRPSAAAAQERLQWIRERPRRVAKRRAMVVVMAALALAATVSTAGFFHARSSQRQAEAARAEAEAVNTFLRSMLASAAPDERGIDTRVVEVLDAAAERVDVDFADHSLSRAAVHSTLGETYLALGVWRASRQQFEEAAAIRKAELGTDHRETIRAEMQAAAAMAFEGRQTEAESALAGLHDRCMRLFGEDDELTMSAGSNLSVVLQKQGRYDEAEPLVRRDVAWKREHLGEEDDRTLGAVMNLGNLLSRLRLEEEAEATFRELLSIQTRKLGADHPDTLATASNLAVLLSRDESRADEATALLDDTIDRKRRVLGEEHPETLRTMGVRAILARRLAHLEEAEQLTREILGIQRSTLPADHPDTLATEMSLGIVLFKQGRLDEAERLLRNALDTAERTLGENHRDTLNVLGNLANVLVAADRPAQAEVYARRLLASCRQSFGDDHPLTLSAANSLGNILIAQDKLAEAGPLVRDTLAAERRVLGPEHPNTLNALGNHARILHGEGRSDEAAAAFRELLEASERIFGHDHPRTTQVRRDLITVLTAAGRSEEAAAVHTAASAGSD
jgi:tetratricopeptide (TPR) repeat protein/tRNA A-37 threonylcarbamoyl transferase component Bud32